MTIEILESRIAPAVLTVYSLLNNGAGSIVDVLNNAHPHDTIVFKPGLSGTIFLSGQLGINKPITIDGPGAGTIIIDAQGDSRVFDVSGFTSAGAAVISGISIVNGNPGSSTGGGIDSLEPLTVKNCVISGNTAESGGGIYARSAAVNIINCQINGNAVSTASGYGGGVDMLTTKGVISGSQFLGNSGARHGGGLYASISGANSSLTIAGSIFADNKAAGPGGAMFVANVATSGKAPVTISNSIISGNTATGSGGGIYARQGAFVAIGDAFIQNSSTGTGGGALYSTKANSITVTGGKFENNSATSGGAVFLMGAFPDTFTGAVFTGNRASSNGGGVDVTSSTAVAITGGTFEGNTASDGGAINIAQSGRTVVTGALIDDNSASSAAGGIRITQAVAATVAAVTHSRIIGNTAQDQGGGAVFSSDATLNLAANTVSGNTALGQAGGGGFYLLGDTSFTISQSSFTANEAIGDGGGIYASTVAGAITTSHITGNIAGSTGGGLFVGGGTFTIPNTASITGNTAPASPNDNLV